MKTLLLFSTSDNLTFQNYVQYNNILLCKMSAQNAFSYRLKGFCWLVSGNSITVQLIRVKLYVC